MSARNEELLLGDIRVVELATMVFAPSASVILAEFGAEVIKVEPPGTGDLNRDYHRLPGMPVSEIPYTFQTDNRNKKSVVLDVKTDSGYEAMRTLLGTADIFVTNVRAQSLRGLKLDYSDLQAAHPRLIYAHASAYGEQGAEQDKPGYDTICYWSRSGIESHVFPYEGWLNAFPFGAGDHPSGVTLFAAIMTALYRRQQTGRGCKVSSSLLANGAWANATMLQAGLCDANFQEKRPRANGFSFTTQHYRSRDNKLLKMSIVNITKDWLPFCAALERPDFPDNPLYRTQEDRLDNMGSLIAEISASFATRDMAHWQAQFERHDIPHAVMASHAEAAADPQKLANGIFVPVHGEAGGNGDEVFRTVTSPFELSDYRKTAATLAPALGQHTQEVLAELGYSAAEIEAIADNSKP